MVLRLYNTRTKEKEAFTPLSKDRVGIYSCGPTVYDDAHIGNLRAYVFADTLRRALEWNGYNVFHVVNLTDIGHLASDADTGEDKMVKALTREGKELTLENMKVIAEHYAKRFEDDLVQLNIIHPDVLPYASEHISEQIELIKTLEAKGFVYTTSDGVYFDTAKDPEYGSFANLPHDAPDQARIAENTEKKNLRDFALWKFSNNTIGWNSPWGTGFPGWHIECSAMSMKYLGETFDIHTGGIDHIPVHHTNEIAQSENATGKPLAQIWMHSAFLNQNDAKMAKSAGGFIRLAELSAHGTHPLAYRYWLLTAHYRSQLNFSFEALDGAARAYENLVARVRALGNATGVPHPGAIHELTDAIADDLDTPRAIATLWDMMKDPTLSDGDKRMTLSEFEKVLGLGLERIAPIIVPDDVQTLVDERENARKNNDWETADVLRQSIEAHGYLVKDTETGPVITPK